MKFADRAAAGRRLAADLQSMRGPDVVVLGLPRGGVPVAAAVAEALTAPLDVIVVRKLGVPFQPELAMGAIGEGGVTLHDDEVIALANVSRDELRAVEDRERAVLAERVARLRRGHGRLDLTGATAVIVDDGLATGSTARVACEVARRLGAARVVVAVPVAPNETLRGLTEADSVVCVSGEDRFLAVGAHYADFRPTSEEEVVSLLQAAQRPMARAGAGDFDGEVQIPVGRIVLSGQLHLPGKASGVVVFAHGSGSSRHSPRNRFVAEVLHKAGLATLLLDLLTPAEERHRSTVFDIELLAVRLRAATHWLAERPDVRGTIGYFGASTGAAAALWAAAEPATEVAAVVSRGGRPDLARARLAVVRAPTLLIVGGSDDAVLELNRQAMSAMRCATKLEIVPGATHLFEEPGTLAAAAELACDWFVRYLTGDRAPA